MNHELRITNQKRPVGRSASPNQGLQAGFTLVELLAVMIVFVAVSSIAIGIIVSTLRGTNKTNTLTTVRNNGNYAMSVMSRTIRNGTALYDPVNDVPTSCIVPLAPTPSPGPQSSITIQSLDGDKTTFTCDGVQGTITSGKTSLTTPLSLLNTSAVKIAPNSCSFTCTQPAAFDYPTITIQFTLTQRNDSSLFEQAASVPFMTTVTMRNVTN